MTRRYVLFLLLIAFLYTGCETATTTKNEETKPASTSTDGDSASAENTKTSDVFLIDVRSQKEWDDGHLETAVHIPHTDIVEGIKSVTKDKDAKICLY